MQEMIFSIEEIKNFIKTNNLNRVILYGIFEYESLPENYQNDGEEGE